MKPIERYTIIDAYKNKDKTKIEAVNGYECIGAFIHHLFLVTGRGMRAKTDDCMITTSTVNKVTMKNGRLIVKTNNSTYVLKKEVL